MVDTSKIYEPDFLNCDLIRALPLDKRTGTILDEGEEVEMTLSGKTVKRLRVNVEFPEKGVKLWTIHRGNRAELARHFGDDSKAWVGKPLRFSVVKGDKGDIILSEPLPSDFFKPYAGVMQT
jgi:hypothetical protein